MAAAFTGLQIRTDRFASRIVSEEWHDNQVVCTMQVEEIRLTHAEYDELTDDARTMYGDVIRIVPTIDSAHA